MILIYKATNIKTNKSYIGQTINLKRRKKEHQSTNKYIFNKEIHKYGIKNFKWNIISKCNNFEEANKKEIYFIKKYNTYYLWKKGGYNMTLGGQDGWRRGYKHTEEAKRKMSILKKGIPRTEETKLKISISHKGKKLTKKHKHSIKLGTIGRIHSKETKKKISISNKGKLKSTSHKLNLAIAKGTKPFYVFYKNKKIGKFNSYIQASKKLKIDRILISKSLKNIFSYKIKKYTFKYVD